jgi:hypothetical protein
VGGRWAETAGQLNAMWLVRFIRMRVAYTLPAAFTNSTAIEG